MACHRLALDGAIWNTKTKPNTAQGSVREIGRREKGRHIRVILLTHIFLLIHGNKCLALNYMENNDSIYFVNAHDIL